MAGFVVPNTFLLNVCSQVENVGHYWCAESGLDVDGLLSNFSFGSILRGVKVYCITAFEV